MALYYGAFFCLRSIIVFLSVYWSKKPRVYSLIGRAITWFIDWIVLTILVVRATEILRSEKALECKTGDEVIGQWYMTTLLCVVFAYVYLALLWFLMPALLVLFCAAVCYFRRA